MTASGGEGAPEQGREGKGKDKAKEAKLPVRLKPSTLKGATTEYSSPFGAAAINDDAQEDSMDIDASVSSTSLDQQATPNSDAISQAIVPVQPSASSAHDDAQITKAVAASTNASARQGGQSVTQPVQLDASGAQDNMRSATAGFSNSSAHSEQAQQSVAPEDQLIRLGEPGPLFRRPPGMYNYTFYLCDVANMYSSANGAHPIFVFRPCIDDMLECAGFVSKDTARVHDVFDRLENRGYYDLPGATQDGLVALERARTRYATEKGEGDVQWLEQFFFSISNRALWAIEWLRNAPEAHYVLFPQDRQQDSHRIEVLQKLIDAFFAYMKAMHMMSSNRNRLQKMLFKR